MQRTQTCHGCKHCLYTAPNGQAWNTQPHSRCKDLSVDVPMIFGEHRKWVGSEIPMQCQLAPSGIERVMP